MCDTVLRVIIEESIEHAYALGWVCVGKVMFQFLEDRFQPCYSIQASYKDYLAFQAHDFPSAWVFEHRRIWYYLPCITVSSWWWLLVKNHVKMHFTLLFQFTFQAAKLAAGCVNEITEQVVMGKVSEFEEKWHSLLM